MNKLIAAILFFFLCLFVYTKLAGPIPFSVNSVQTTKSTTFDVSGDGSATAVPNTATISFGVTKQATTVADAQNQTNTAINSIMDKLNSLGIDTKNIKTTNYNVNPNYNLGDSQSISGYTVTQSVEVKVDPLDKVNKTLDTLTASGANIVGQVSFGFDDATKQKLEDQARADAVKVAKEKAQSLANAASIHLGSIINVTENQNTPGPIMLNTAKLGGGAGESAPSQVTPGENTVSTTVTLSYQIY
jgi:hypothetical protein